MGTEGQVTTYTSSCPLLIHRNDECVEGGESVLLDMFAVAEELRTLHPQHFKTLTQVPATFQKVHYDRCV